MPRTEEAAAWFAAVYSAVQQIPPGKVTSYGHIAYLLGQRKPEPSRASLLLSRAYLNDGNSKQSLPV